jgi:hypothetical protein
MLPGASAPLGPPACPISACIDLRGLLGAIREGHLGAILDMLWRRWYRCGAMSKTRAVHVQLLALDGRAALGTDLPSVSIQIEFGLVEKTV